MKNVLIKIFIGILATVLLTFCFVASQVFVVQYPLACDDTTKTILEALSSGDQNKTKNAHIVRTYRDNTNTVVVMNETDYFEQGLYVIPSYSSFFAWVPSGGVAIAYASFECRPDPASKELPDSFQDLFKNARVMRYMKLKM